MKPFAWLNLLLLLLLALPLPTAARPVLSPAAVPPGGVSLLRWEGEAPVAVEVRFNGREVPARPADPLLALLGADLGLAPGTYPVTLTGQAADGGDFAYHLPLEVTAVHWEEERLTLPEEMVSPKSPEVQRRIAREYAQLQELFAGVSDRPLPGRFRLPVADPLGSPFGLRRILNGQPKSPHAGVDFRSPRGTPVRAPGEGRTVFAGDLYYTGQTVILDHGAGLFSLYAHLEEILTRQGEEVAAGAPLGRVGSTGRSTGPHLHWGVKLRGDRIDPLAVIDLLAGQAP